MDRVFPKSKRANMLVVYVVKKGGGVHHLRQWLPLSIKASKILFCSVYTGVKPGRATTTNIDVITDILACL